jgi:hypothetical protein
VSGGNHRLEAEQVIQAKLAQCGLPVDGFSVRYENDLQSIEVFIPAGTDVKIEQFECIHCAAGSHIVTIEDPKCAAAFRDFQNEKLRPHLLAQVTKDAEAAGLLANFPVRRDFHSLRDFAEALEKHVGVTPGLALRAESNRIIVLPPVWGGLDANDRRFQPLITAVTYASFSDEGTQFGFIGNEAFVPHEKDK